MFFDYTISQAVYNLVVSYPTLKLLAIFCASVLIWLMLVWFVIVYVWHKRAWQTELVALFLGIAGTYGLNGLIGWWFFRLRPFVTLQLEPLIKISPLSKSFPSDHSAIAFLFAYLLSVHKKSWRPLVFTLAVLVAVGRVAVGVHYLTDIVAGAVIGLALGWSVEQLEKIFRRQQKL